MPWAQYWKRSYHLAAQLSKLKLISCWQCSLSKESLVMPGGLILCSIAVMAASPLVKQGMVMPLVEYISFTSISTLFWCFFIALNPLVKLIITRRSINEISWSSMNQFRQGLRHTRLGAWMDSLFLAKYLFQAYLRGKNQSLCERFYHFYAEVYCHYAYLWPVLCTSPHNRQPNF